MSSDPYKDLLESLKSFKEEQYGEGEHDDFEEDEFDMFADEYEDEEEVE